MSAPRLRGSSPAPDGPVFILEGNASGHRFYYVRLLADAIIDRGGQPVLVTTPSQMDSPQAVEFLRGLPSSFTVVEIPSADVHPVSQLARDMGAGRVVIPDGDRHLIPLLTRRGRDLPHMTALIMREPDLRPSQGIRSFVRQILKFATMTLVSLRGSTTVAVLKSSVWAGKSRFPVAQDPVTLAATADDVFDVREQWGLDRGRRWFAVVGAITARKNLPMVAEAFTRIAGDGVGLLVGGAILDGQLAEAKPHLSEARQRGARVVVVDRMLEDKELDAAIAAVDCVVLAHSNEGPSGIFGKAVVSGTRLLVSGASSLRNDARAVPTHARWTPLSVEAIAQGMADASIADRPLAVSGMNSSRFTSALL